MLNVFAFIALLMLLICAALRFAPSVKLLNFVEYGTPEEVARLNRLAANWLLLPLAVNAACMFVAAAHPGLTVPLIFLTPLSVLVVVVCINAKSRRARVRGDKDR